MPTLTLDETTHVYTLDGKPIPGVTSILKSAGIIDDRWYTEAASKRGRAVHAACHYLDEGDLDWNTVHPRIVSRIEAYKKFRADSGFQISSIEKAIYSSTYLFAGKPDRLGLLAGQPAIVDLKSGDAPAWVALQLAGYSICLPEPTSWKRYALMLLEDGTYRLKEFNDRNDGKVFLSCLALHNWRLNHGIVNS